jgi:acetyl esterase/lipase
MKEYYVKGLSLKKSGIAILLCVAAPGRGYLLSATEPPITQDEVLYDGVEYKSSRTLTPATKKSLRQYSVVFFVHGGRWIGGRKSI